MDRKGGGKGKKGGGQKPHIFSYEKEVDSPPQSLKTGQTQNVVVPAEKSLRNAQNKAFNSYQGQEKVRLEFNAHPEQFKAQIKNELVDSQGYTLPVPPPTTSTKDHDQSVLLEKAGVTYLTNPIASASRTAVQKQDSAFFKTLDKTIESAETALENDPNKMHTPEHSVTSPTHQSLVEKLLDEKRQELETLKLRYKEVKQKNQEQRQVIEALKVEVEQYSQFMPTLTESVTADAQIPGLNKSLVDIAKELCDMSSGHKSEFTMQSHSHKKDGSSVKTLPKIMQKIREEVRKRNGLQFSDLQDLNATLLNFAKVEQENTQKFIAFKAQAQNIFSDLHKALLTHKQDSKSLQNKLEKQAEQKLAERMSELQSTYHNEVAEEVRKEVKECTKDLDKQLETVRQIKEDWQTLLSEKKALQEALDAEQAISQKSTQDFENYKKAHEQQLADLQKLLSAEQEKTKHFEEVETLSERQKTQIEQYRQELTKAKQKIQNLTKDLEESQIKQQESDKAVTNMYDQLQSQIQQRESAEKQLRKNAEELEKHIQNLVQIPEIHGELKNTAEALSTKQQELTRAQDELRLKQQELTNLNREYNRLTADKEQLEREKAALETELQPLRDVNMTIDELIDVAAHAEQRKKENENLRQAINEKERELLNKQAELDNITSQLETKGTELRDKQEELTLLQEECKKLAEDKTAAEQTFAEQLKNLEHQLNTAKSELRTQQEVYKQQLAELTQQFDQYKIKAKQDLEEQERSLKRGYDTALAVARDSHAAEKADLTEQHQQELEKQKEDFAAERQKLKDEHDAAIDRLNATHQEELNKLRADLEAQHQLELEEKTREFNEKKLELEKAYDAAVTGLQDKHNAEIAKLDTDHQEALNELRKTLEETHAQAIKELRQKKEQEYHKLEEQYHELEKDFQALREFYEEDASAPDNATEDVDVSYSDAYAGQEEELGIEKTVEKFHYKELSKKLKTALQKIATLQAEKDQLAKRLEEEKKIFETRLQAEKAFNQFLNESTEREAPPHHDKLKEAETAQAMLKAQLDDIEQRYKDDMIEAQSNLTSLNKQNDENKRQFQNNLDELRKQHDQQLEYLRKWHIQDLQEKDQEILDMQITYQQELKHLQQQFERADLLKLQEYQQLEQHYRQLAQEKQQIEQQLNNKQNLAAQDESSKEQLNKLRSYYTTLQDRLTSTQQEMSQLAKLRQQDQDSYKTKEAEWQLKIEQLQAEQKKLLAIKQATEQQQKKVTRDQAVATEPEVAKKPEQEDKALKAQPVQELTTQNIRPYAAIPNYAAPAFTANNYGYGAINAAAYSPKPIQQPLTVKAQPQVATTPIARVRDSVAISANNNNFVNNATRGNLDPNKATIVGGTGVTATSGTMAGLCAAGLFGGAAVIPASLAFGLCAAGSATFTGAKAVNKPNGFAQRIANERSFASAELGA